MVGVQWCGGRSVPLDSLPFFADTGSSFRLWPVSSGREVGTPEGTGYDDDGGGSGGMDDVD